MLPCRGIGGEVAANGATALGAERQRNRRSTSAARCCAICSTTPASQVMVLEAGSISRILSSRRSETTTSPWCGVWPPTRPYCRPAAPARSCARWRALQIADTSAVEPGRNTRGERPWKQVAFLGDIGRDIGGIGDRIFVADNSAEFCDQLGRQRRHGALNDIHGRLLFHSRSFILVRRLRAQPVVDGFAQSVVGNGHYAMVCAPLLSSARR